MVVRIVRIVRCESWFVSETSFHDPYWYANRFI